MRRRGFLIAAAATALTAPAKAQEGAPKAIGGDWFVVDDEEFRLADIIAPSPFALHASAEPFFRESKSVLASLLRGARLEIVDAAPRTRWGVRVVSARRVGDAHTLQENMIARAAARVAPQTDDISLIARLLSMEKAARAASRGLWALGDYHVFDASAAEDAVGGFHLIEGRVVRARLARGRFYLNFGADFRKDFTASAATRPYRRWQADGFDLATLEGASLRVRGFVNAINGPSIDLTHAKQIEVIASA